jgi:hypothetical protein
MTKQPKAPLKLLNLKNSLQMAEPTDATALKALKKHLIAPENTEVMGVTPLGNT